MQAKALIKWTVGIFATLAGTFVILLIGGFVLLNTHWLQQKMLSKAVGLLTEKLETRVGVDSVSIDLLALDAKLYGLTVEDRQQRPMLGVQFVRAGVDVSALLRECEIYITEVRLEGVKAELHKAPQGEASPDTVPNYQFLLDAFKPADKGQAEKSRKPRETGKGPKLNVQHSTFNVKAEHIDIAYNDNRMQLGLLNYYRSAVDEQQIELQGLHLKTDNHRPRKNTNRPKRGAFDTGHLDILADMKLKVESISQGMVHGFLTDCTVSDTLTGIDIHRLKCEVTFAADTLQLNDVYLQQGTTELHFDKGTLRLPNKKDGTRLEYTTSTISGTAVLHDISRPFAPVLGNFTIPLQFSARMDGDDEGMHFHDVVVKRPANKLLVKASGYISNLKDKHRLKVHFDIQQATFKAGEKERIINQFKVKKFMMEQLHRLGTVRYAGSFDVLWKREEFRGILQTETGKLKFQFALDEANKYLLGEASTDHLEIGRIMKMPDIGVVAASAKFKFDISKPRTARMRRQLGGKLPIGDLTAHVDKASYKFVKVGHLDVQIASNGAVAEGTLSAPKKLADMNVDFSFTNTSEMKKMKVKPRLLFHRKKSAKTR